MIRLGMLVAVMIAGSAFATGERIALTPGSPLQETLCFSMDCTRGEPDATVTTRQVKGGLEVTVLSATGQRRLSCVVPLRDDGTLSSTELVRATSLVLKAIEDPDSLASSSEPPARVKKVAKKVAKRPSHKNRMYARR